MFDEIPQVEAPFGNVNRLQVDLSDADLVAELVKNRPEAHRLALQRFAPLVRGLLLRSLGGENDIDDLQQEVFWCLFRRVTALRDPLSLRPFVMAITLRTVFHERRRRRTLGQLMLLPEPAQLDRPTKRDEAVASYAFVRLGELVKRLRERERRTFVLRFVEGMTVSEIAESLAISHATTRRSFTRAWLSVNKWAERDPFLSDYLGECQPLPALD